MNFIWAKANYVVQTLHLTYSENIKALNQEGRHQGVNRIQWFMRTNLQLAFGVALKHGALAISNFKKIEILFNLPTSSIPHPPFPILHKRDT